MFKRYFKILLYTFFLPLILLFLISVLNLPDVISNILSLCVILFMYIGLLAIIFNIQIKPKKYKKENSIFNWMDELPDYDDKFAFMLINQHNKYRTIDNLIIIKNVIFKQTNRDFETIKLYRAFYRQLQKENSDDLYLKSALSFLIPLSLYIFKENQIGIIGTNYESWFLSILMFFITIAFIANKLTVNQKRHGLIIEILELCIEEIEQKEETASK